MTRSIYRSLLWLHPPGFRRQFAGEMLWIFDEAAAVEGRGGLLLDAATSLLRQWFVGCGAWKVVAGLAGGALQLGAVWRLWLELPAPARGVRDLPLGAVTTAELDFSRALALVFAMLVLSTAGLVAARGRGARHGG